MLRKHSNRESALRQKQNEPTLIPIIQINKFIIYFVFTLQIPNAADQILFIASEGSQRTVINILCHLNVVNVSRVHAWLPYKSDGIPLHHSLKLLGYLLGLEFISRWNKSKLIYVHIGWMNIQII